MNVHYLILSWLYLIGFWYYARGVEEEKYTTKYDDLDVDAIIRNERLLKKYVECIMEKGPCTPDGAELKKNIPEAIQTDCSKCSEKQKELTDKVLQNLMENEPQYWEILKNRYDPTETYTKKHFGNI